MMGMIAMIVNCWRLGKLSWGPKYVHCSGEKSLDSNGVVDSDSGRKSIV